MKVNDVAVCVAVCISYTHSYAYRSDPTQTMKNKCRFRYTVSYQRETCGYCQHFHFYYSTTFWLRKTNPPHTGVVGEK